MDELYVIARRVLLDALEALGEHRDATILVGAQAIYLHTGAAELGVAEYTTDADLALDPALLAEIPPLEQALEGAGFFSSTSTIGIWKTSRRTSQAIDIDVQVDLLVPATVSPGAGRRAARLAGHGVHAARNVDGLEGVLVDQAEHDIASLEVEGVSPKDKREPAGAVSTNALTDPAYRRAVRLFLEDLSMRDADFLVDEFDRVDCGVDTAIEVECPECFTLQEVELPFDRGFFLPGKARTARRWDRTSSSLA